MNLESDFSFISYSNSDDVTLVQPIPNDFTNRRFMISFRIYIDHVPFIIAKFDALSITIRSCSTDI